MPMILPLEAKRWNRFVALLASAFFFLCLPIGTNDEFDVRHRIDRCPDERKTRVKHATTYSCMGGFMKIEASACTHLKESQGQLSLLGCQPESSQQTPGSTNFIGLQRFFNKPAK